MLSDPNRTRTISPTPTDGATHDFDLAFDAGLAVAFAADATPGGWSRPPLLRDDASDGPVVRPGSVDMPKGDAGRYQLLGEIARGGMGVVLKGRDPDLGRDLAVKVLKGEFAGRLTAEQRFVEEAQVGGQLQHPGIVPVYELGRFADGRPFFTMKLVKGRTLAALLAERPNPEHGRGLFLKHFERICETVAFAHSRGVIHRDLKPANVMVGNFGEVQVMDWGLAKVLPQGGVADERLASRERKRPEETEPTVIRTARYGSAGSETQAGSILGTPAFMPPEQAGGEIDKLDERADVFGLGAILCVILTGEPPYVGNDGEAVRLLAIRGKLEAAFAQLDACGADPELIGLAKRCLAPERDDRPRHAGEVAAAVHDYLAGVEARAQKAEVDRGAAEARAEEEAKTRRVAEEKSAVERKRRKLQVALAAAVGLLAVGGGGFGWWVDHQAGLRRVEREVIAERNRQATEVALDQAEAALGKEYPVYEVVDTALAQAERRLADIGPGDVQDRFDRLRAARGMLDRLDAVENTGFKLRGEELLAFMAARVKGNKAELYQSAYRDYGIDLDAETAETLAERIRRSPITTRLIGGLFEWTKVRGPKSLAPLLCQFEPELARIIQLLGPAENKVDAYVAWVKGLDGRTMSRNFALYIGAMNITPTEEALRILRAAQSAHPADYRLASAIRHRLPFDHLDERIAYGRVALACRPNYMDWHVLGADLAVKALSDDTTPSLRESVVKEAVTAYQESLRLDPTFYESRLNIGQVLLLNHQPDAAIPELREYIRRNPNSAAAFHSLGLALAQKKEPDPDGAIVAYQKAIDLAPKNANYHYDLGVVLSQSKMDVDRAVAAFRKAIDLDPKNAVYHHGLGLGLTKTNDFDGAVAAFRQAIRLDPKNANYYYDMAIALADGKKDYDAAVLANREAIRLKPDFAEAYCNLAEVLDLQGKIAEAVPLLRKGHELGSKRPDWKYPSAKWVAEYEQKLAAQRPRELAPPPRAKQ